MIDVKRSALQLGSEHATSDPIEAQERGSKSIRFLPPEQLTKRILVGDRSALARAITLIESSQSEDRIRAEQIIEACLPHSGNSMRGGVTGIPGAGKSTLIETLGKHLITEHGGRVAVLAIDPTSQLSGGSILGDKTRMMLLASSDSAFIRPSPSRGALGGVAHHTHEAILLCEAAGYRTIFIETVGVGQSEVAVRDMVDFFLLVTLAGAGDELQGIKRGALEMANLIAVNKSDGDNIQAAQHARAEAESALHLLPLSPSGWVPRAIACSARTNQGIAELWSCVHQYATLTEANGWFHCNRREQIRRRMRDNFEQALIEAFRSDLGVQQRLTRMEVQVLAGRVSALRAVRELIDLYAPRQNP